MHQLATGRIHKGLGVLGPFVQQVLQINGDIGLTCLLKLIIPVLPVFGLLLQGLHPPQRPLQTRNQSPALAYQRVYDIDQHARVRLFAQVVEELRVDSEDIDDSLFHFKLKIMTARIASLEMSISFDKLSPKQLICECLDMATAVLKELISLYHSSKNEEMPFNSNSNDFYKILNFVLEPAMLQNLLTFCKVESNDRYSIRTWLFELKSLRNTWAHSTTLEFRQAHRAFDTLELLVSKFGANRETEQYRKINTYRKLLAVKIAQEYIAEDKLKNAHNQQVNFQNNTQQQNHYHQTQNSQQQQQQMQQQHTQLISQHPQAHTQLQPAYHNYMGAQQQHHPPQGFGFHR